MNVRSRALVEQTGQESRDTDVHPDEQRIVDRIFSAVMEQRLSPRTKLSEATLCDSFGVGRMRVRRALLLLASQGIVELQSNRGAYVACPDAREARDVFAARLLLESGLVRDMAARDDANVIRDLRGHLELENAARQHARQGEIIRLSGEFHVKMARSLGNAVLTRFLRELVTRTSLIVGLFGVDRGATCPEDEHGRIVEAIAAGDGETAAAVVRGHLNHIQEGLDLSTIRKEQPDLAGILGAP